MPFNPEYRDLENDDFNSEDIDKFPEDERKGKGDEAWNEFVGEEKDNYNREKEKYPAGDSDGEISSADEIVDEDGNPAEHLSEENKEEQESLEQIVRRAKGYKKDGVFHSTEPYRVWEKGGEEKIVKIKDLPKVGLDERKRLIRMVQKRKRQKSN